MPVFVSLLIALFATAGAIPLCRRVHGWYAASHATVEAAPADSPPRVAGAGVFLGVLISLFYSEGTPDSGTPLLGGGLLLVFLGAWWARHSRRVTWRLKDLFYEIGASAVAGAALLFVMPLGDISSLSSTSFVAALILLTPAAVLFIARSPSSSPALTPGVVMTQLALLLVLGVLAPPDSFGLRAPVDLLGTALYEDFGLIAIPTLGALMGAMFYLCSMPWRPQAGIDFSVPARLCLGILVAWGGTSLALGRDTDAGQCVAVAWILAPPIFEFVRTCVIAPSQGRQFQSDPSSRREFRSARFSRTAAVALATLFGSVGISLQQLQAPPAWSLIALLPSLVVYLVVARWLSSTSGYCRPTPVIDGSRASLHPGRQHG